MSLAEQVETKKRVSSFEPQKPLTGELSNPLFDKIKAYLASEKLASRPVSTRRAYVGDVFKFLEFSTSDDIQSIDKVNASVTQRFEAYLRLRDNSDRTIARAFSGVKDFLRWIDAPDEVVNSFSQRGRGFRNNLRYTYLPLEQCEAFQKEALAVSEREGALVSLILHGARMSEAIGVRAENLAFDGETDTVLVKLHFGKDIRILKVQGESLYKAFKNLAAGKLPEESIFKNQRGRNITRQGEWFWIKKIAQSLGIEGVNTHNLRLAVIRDLFKKDDIMQALGVTADRAVIIRYSLRDRDRLFS